MELSRPVMVLVQPRNDISLEGRTDEGCCSGVFTVVLTVISLVLVLCTFPFSLCVCVRMVQVIGLNRIKYYFFCNKDLHFHVNLGI